MTTPTDSPPSPAWQVICLCADWCGVCREWKAAFAEAASAHPQVRFEWVDVEDEAEAMGEVDIETFPTVLVAHGRRACFLGPVLPSAGPLSRLLESLMADPLSPGRPGSAADALLSRIQLDVLQKR